MGQLLSSLVITLREGIEGALAVAIILLYLRKTGRLALTPAVWWGVGLAVAASIAGSFALQKFPINSELLEGTLMFVAAIFVGTMILWMWKSSKGLKKEIENKLEEIATRQDAGGIGISFAIFSFTFLMIVREGMETVIFLRAVNFTTSALLSFLGGIIGLVLAVLFGVFFVRGSIRVDLGRFFKITGIVLMLFVVQLVIGGIHELGEGGLFEIGPREMAIVGPIVNYNALFLIGILLIPFLMLVIPPRVKTTAESASQAERRLQLAQQQRQARWRVGAAALSLCIVLFIAYDFVYAQTKKALSSPEPVQSVAGEIRLPINRFQPGTLQRFLYTGTLIRFIVVNVDGKVIPAFDACQICGSQGYNMESGSLICLNCAADINPSSVGREGGCNPIPLPYSVQGNDMVIRAADLKAEEPRFVKK